MLSELGTWFVRIAKLLPELIGLWEAAKGGNPQQELEAQLSLVRAMKDQQAWEDIHEP